MRLTRLPNGLAAGTGLVSRSAPAKPAPLAAHAGDGGYGRGEDDDGADDCVVTGVRTAAARTAAAGLDEGLRSLSLPNLLYMKNPYSYKKCQ